jgi:hypothetical protein
MTDIRKAGLRGLRESHSPVKAHLYRVATFITPPESGDVSQGITDWGMLNNDHLGCCGPAAKAHLAMLKACLGLNDQKQPTYQPDFTPPTDASVQADYFGYGISMGEPGPSPDQGVDNASYLMFEYKKGMIELFGEIDLNNLPEGATEAQVIQRAMLDFNGCLVGVTLNKDAEQQFENHVPWSIGPNDQPEPNEGHDIAFVAYGPSGEIFATWGASQDATVAWESACITDVWVFGTKDDAEKAGYDSAAWSAALADLSNTTGSVPTSDLPPAVKHDAEVDFKELLKDLHVAIDQAIEKVGAAELIKVLMALVA